MNNKEKPFIFRILDAKPRFLLELENTSENALRSVEILTIFLKEEDSAGGGQSVAHIRFDAVTSISPKDRAVVSHRTWINGKPARDERDQMDRLRAIEGEANPYVLDISWQNPEGKTRFQRIPIGH